MDVDIHRGQKFLLAGVPAVLESSGCEANKGTNFVVYLGEIGVVQEDGVTLVDNLNSVLHGAQGGGADAVLNCRHSFDSSFYLLESKLILLQKNPQRASYGDMFGLVEGGQKVDQRNERPCLPCTWRLRPDLFELGDHVEVGRYSDRKLHHTWCLVRLRHHFHQGIVRVLVLLELIQGDTFSTSDGFHVLLQSGEVLGPMSLGLRLQSDTSGDYRIFTFFQSSHRGVFDRHRWIMTSAFLRLFHCLTGGSQSFLLLYILDLLCVGGFFNLDLGVKGGLNPPE